MSCLAQLVNKAGLMVPYFCEQVALIEKFDVVQTPFNGSVLVEMKIALDRPDGHWTFGRNRLGQTQQLAFSKNKLSRTLQLNVIGFTNHGIFVLQDLSNDAIFVGLL